MVAAEREAKGRRMASEMEAAEVVANTEQQAKENTDLKAAVCRMKEEAAVAQQEIERQGLELAISEQKATDAASAATTAKEETRFKSDLEAIYRREATKEVVIESRKAAQEARAGERVESEKRRYAEKELAELAPAQKDAAGWQKEAQAQKKKADELRTQLHEARDLL